MQRLDKQPSRAGAWLARHAPRVRAEDICLLALSLFAACDGKPGEPPAVGTLERDRIELISEAPEPIIDIPTLEGSRVEAGDPIVIQDETRLAAELAAAEAEHKAAGARLAELTRGTREEEVDEARAHLREAESALAEALPELKRIRSLVEQGVESRRSLERAEAILGEAEGRRDAAHSFLSRLLNGATPEELDQARAAVAGSEASADEVRLRKARLRVTAPSVGVIDALPFEIGERPPAGAVVAVLLADGAPYARVYVPAALRPRIRPGTPASVRVEGIEGAFAGHVRRVSAEAAFTPYYALTERDRGRLAYLAEIELTGADATSLPTGLSVEATFALAAAVQVPADG